MAYTVRKDFFDWLDNTIVGNGLDEKFIGGDGDDKLVGKGGEDWIMGDDGDDKLFGGEGDDTLQGGADDDHLFGGEGHDGVSGGSGNDTLYFSGEDDYSGGTGTDTFVGRALDFIDVESGGAHNLTVFSSPFAAGLRISIENGVAELRDPALEGPNSDLRTAFFENHYSDDIPAFPVGRGIATFSSIERYELTELGDYFEGDDTSDTILALGGDDVIEGKGGADTIKGGEGSDTVEYGSQGLEAAGQPNDPSNDVGVNVDLERGTGLIGDAEGDTFDSIENIRGSAFIDALSGTDGVNFILARGGNDFVEGRGGADSLDGGTGIDEVLYASSGSSVDVNLTRATQLGGDAQGDRLANFENISGSAFGDRLRGDGGINKISGLGGSDTIDGGHGNDILIGGDGVSTDIASFESWDNTLLVQFPARITLGETGSAGEASLAFREIGANFQFTTVLETDQLFGFESVRGSNLNEIITGNGQANTIEGRGGADVIDGGHGNDILIGGDDNVTDTVSFESWDFTLSVTAPAQITLGEPGSTGEATLAFRELGPNFQFTTVIEKDQLSGFENVRGSNLTETITGNGKVNVLEGRGGNDVISGQGGNDTLVGGAGLDTLDGGQDSDTFKFFNAADMPVADFASGNAIIRLERITAFDDAGIQQDIIDFSNIRTVNGSRLFLDDHDGVAFELGEIMTLTNGNGNSFISADTSGDGVVDLALEIGGGIITTLDGTDFLL